MLLNLREKRQKSRKKMMNLIIKLKKKREGKDILLEVVEVHSEVGIELMIRREKVETKKMMLLIKIVIKNKINKEKRGLIEVEELEVLGVIEAEEEVGENFIIMILIKEDSKKKEILKSKTLELKRKMMSNIKRQRLRVKLTGKKHSIDYSILNN